MVSLVVEVSPRSRDEGAGSIRQDEHKVQPLSAMRPAQDREGLPAQGMVRAKDGHLGRKVLEVGSV